jgi:hypothetical protein
MANQIIYPNEIDINIECLHCKRPLHVTVHLDLALITGKITLAYSDKESADAEAPPKAEH